MLGLITDRTQNNVDRLKELHNKGWDNMSWSEMQEWRGDPLQSTGAVNLLPHSGVSTDEIDIRYRNESITLTAVSGGSDLYSVFVLGSAAEFWGKTITLSLDAYFSSAGGTPQVSLCWYDEGGSEAACEPLTGTGSMTCTLSGNTELRQYLAAFIHIPDGSAGDYIRYERLMLEFGDERHEYVPYTAVLATNTTKGAYNYSDLNRVEMAVADLAEKLGLSLETKTNWTAWDAPTQSDMNRYLKNIAVLRRYSRSQTTIPGSMTKLTYATANDIEKVLADVSAACAALFRSGEIYCGEV